VKIFIHHRPIWRTSDAKITILFDEHVISDAEYITSKIIHTPVNLIVFSVILIIIQNVNIQEDVKMSILSKEQRSACEVDGCENGAHQKHTKCYKHNYGYSQCKMENCTKRQDAIGYCLTCLKSHGTEDEQLTWMFYNMVKNSLRADQVDRRYLESGQVKITSGFMRNLFENTPIDCYSCEKEMETLGINRREHPDAITIERIKNKKHGHYQGNVTFACNTCNTLRGDRHDMEFMKEHGKVMKLGTHKYCPLCDEVLEINKFGMHNKKRLGRAAMCKPCANQHKKEYRNKKRKLADIQNNTTNNNNKAQTIHINHYYKPV